jgi:16S rRNA processing protein RimM
MVADAETRFVVGTSLATNEDVVRMFEVESVRSHDGDYLVRLHTVTTRNHAQGLVGVQFVVDKSDRRELGEEEWWVEDLVGCAVVSDTDGPVGRVTNVETGSAQDRLVCETSDGRRGEIPLVAEIVLDVDLETRRIVVDLPAGLIE